MKRNISHKTITILIAIVWLVNGLYCKILNQVPRHKEIVGTILGNEYSSSITIIIGVLEIIMAIWIVSGYKYKLNAIIQITVIMVMNIIEFVYVPNLLLWGKLNILFAFLFVALIYFNNFKNISNVYNT